MVLSIGRKEMEQISQLALKALALLLVFVAPIQAILIATLALIGADTITGVWASLKEKQRITSHKLRRTVAKSLAYMLGIVVAHIIEQYMIEGIPIVKTVGGLIAITEAKSIFENLYRITGVNFWQVLLDKLQGTSIKIPSDKK